MYVQDYDELTPAYGRPGNHTGQTGLALSYYTWHEVTQPYVKNWQLFKCPSNATVGPNRIDCCGRQTEQWGYSIGGFSYPNKVYLLGGAALAQIQVPAETFWMSEWQAPGTGCEFIYPGVYAWGTAPPSYADSCLGGRVNHNDGANYAYYDGHVKWLNQNSIRFNMYTGEAD